MRRSLLLLLGLFAGSQSARILAYFPTLFRSHHFFSQPSLVELGRLGHRVDYYSPYDMDVYHPNVTRIPLEDYSGMLLNLSIPKPWYNFLLAENERALVQWYGVSEYAAERACESHAVQELLQSIEQYDLILHEGIALQEIGNVFAHKFKALSVVFSPINDGFHLNEMTGLNTNPSFMVNSLTQSSDEMNFLERLKNAYSYLTFTFLVYYPYVDRIQTIADKCYRYPGWEGRPTVRQLVKDQALVLVNAHPSIGFPYPRPPHFKEIGGATIKPGKPLPKDLSDFMNDAKHGVIYFSLGTLVSMGEVEHLKNIFATVYAGRKERILWKWSGKPLPNPPDNVMFSEFFPQQDVLAHPNLKLFISHAGLQSAFEAVWFAVPIILIPFIADQPKNAFGLEKLELGVRLDKDNVSLETLNWAIDEVITQPRYKEQALKNSAALRNRPMDPVKESVYWIEYVLKHGKILQPACLTLSVMVFHNVDVYAFVIFVSITTFFVTRNIIQNTRNWLLG